MEVNEIGVCKDVFKIRSKNQMKQLLGKYSGLKYEKYHIIECI